MILINYLYFSASNCSRGKSFVWFVSLVVCVRWCVRTCVYACVYVYALCVCNTNACVKRPNHCGHERHLCHMMIFRMLNRAWNQVKEGHGLINFNRFIRGIYGYDRQYTVLSFLFNSMTIHGFSPDDMVISSTCNEYAKIDKLCYRFSDNSLR